MRVCGYTGSHTPKRYVKKKKVAPRALAMALRKKRDRAFLRFLAKLRQQYEPR